MNQSKVRRAIVGIGLAIALALNISIVIKLRSADQELFQLRKINAAQIATVARAKELSSEAENRYRTKQEQFRRIESMSKWCRTREDFVIRGGKRIFSQVWSESNHRLRLWVYIPPGNHQLVCAYKEVWDNNLLHPHMPLAGSGAWRDVGEFKLPTGQVHELIFSVDPLDRYTNLKVVATGYQSHVRTIRQSIVRGNRFGQYFTMMIPNQRFGGTSTDLWGWGKSADRPNEILRHTFTLQEPYYGFSGKLALRCWLRSEAPMAASANYVAAYFDTFVSEFSSHPIDDLFLGDHFQPYDGSGTLYFKAADHEWLTDMTNLQD